MMPFIWGLLGAASAVGLEALYRKTDASFLALFPIILPLQCVISFVIFQIVRGADNVIAVAIIFSSFTAILRFTFTVVNGDDVSAANWLAFTLIVLAASIKFGEAWHG